MILQDLCSQLDRLYQTTPYYEDQILIYPSLFFDGDGMRFTFRLEEDKYARIEISENFGEWMACYPGGWKAVEPHIRRFTEPFGVEWDGERGILFIRFRRNEMSVAQAVLRLEQAALVVGNLEILTGMD